MSDVETNANAMESDSQMTNSQQPDGQTQENPSTIDSSNEEGQQSSSTDDEVITMTRAQFAAQSKKIREIAERKARNQLKAEMEVQTAAPAQTSIPPATDPNTIWDPALQQYIPLNMSIADYAELAAQKATNSSQIPPQSMQQAAGAVKPVQSEGFCMEAEEQAIRLSVEIPDFEETLKGAPITAAMANEASRDNDGMRVLYEKWKNDPREIAKISQLSPDQQKRKVWQMTYEHRLNKNANKLKSNAIPQADPLPQGGSNGKSFSELSYAEKKRQREKEIWGD